MAVMISTVKVMALAIVALVLLGVLVYLAAIVVGCIRYAIIKAKSKNGRRRR